MWDQLAKNIPCYNPGFEWITTVIKYNLITRNRLWNTGAVTQETLQNSSLGKISVSFRVKEK